MKLSLVMFFIAALSVSANERVMSQKVTLNFKNAELRDVFRSIREQTGHQIIYSEDKLRADKTVVSVNVKDAQLSEALDILLKDIPYTYVVRDQSVMIMPRQETSRQSQRITVAGTVREPGGSPVIMASVVVKGTTVGVVTDRTGKFSLTFDPSAGDVLQFSMMGMETVEVTVGARREFDIVMKEKLSYMDEVVITGYQTLNKREMVGAYTSLKMDDIMLPNYSSIDQMLQGQVAGLMVTNTSLRAGSSPTITLRGTSTLLGTKSPLWVVDGIIQQDVEDVFKPKNSMITSTSGNDIASLIGNSISWLSPNDIESIVVLKDATATAIYGSRASNGVIVITTKKGKTDKVTVNYSMSASVSFRPTYDDYYLMNSRERINFSKESFDADAKYQTVPLPQMYTYEGLMLMRLQNRITEEEFIRQFNYLETVNTDWLDLLTRTTFNHKHNLSLSGLAGTKGSYNVSLNYDKNNGIEKGNDSERFSGRINLDLTPVSRLRLNFSLVGTMSKTMGFSSNVNPQNYAITASRAIPATDPDGAYTYYQKEAEYILNSAQTRATGFKYNILNELDNTYTRITSPQFNATFNGSWDVLGDNSLRYELVLGYTNNSRVSEAYADERTFYIARNYRGYDYGTVSDVKGSLFKAAMLPYGGEMFRNTTSTSSYNVQNKVTYTKTLNDKHRFNALAAMEISSNTVESNNNQIFGFLKKLNDQVVTPPTPSEVVPLSGLYDGWGLARDIFRGYVVGSQTNNYLSYFASLTYTFDGFLSVNISARNDFSNRFGQDVNNRFDPTYSLGASYWLSDHGFMEALKPYLSTLAIRATYGIQGNALTNQSPDLILTMPSLSSVYNEFTSTISKLPNRYLDWERTTTLNMGMNLGFFDDRIMVDVDGYHRKSKPLSSYPLSPEYGEFNMVQNGAVINNSGIEITAKFDPVRTRDSRLSMSVNFSKNWNKVKKKSEDSTLSINTASYLNGNLINGMLLERGYPVSGFWIYDFDRLDESGYPLFNRMDGESGTTPLDFLVYAGSREPVIAAGINLNFQYRNFSLNTGLAANLGGKMLLPDPFANFFNGRLPSPEYNVSKELNNRWKSPGDEAITNIPAVYSGGRTSTVTDPSGYQNTFYTMWARSNARLVSGSFLRCRQIAVSWRMPSGMLEPLGVQNLMFTGSVNNIFVIASDKFKGMDPELGTSVAPKSLSFSVNIVF